MQEIWNLEISIKTLDKIDSESVSIITGKLIDCVVLKQKRSDFKSVLKTKLNVIQVTLLFANCPLITEIKSSRQKSFFLSDSRN